MWVFGRALRYPYEVNGDEERGEERRQRRRPVSLVVDYEGPEDLLQDYTENLSAGGTFVHTERALPIGSSVHLLLSFPGLVRPIALAGTVRWSRSGNPEDRGVGIEFDDYAGDTAQRLAEVIDAISRRDPDVVSRVLQVLVVEDNPHVAQLIREGLSGGALGSVECACRSVDTGTEALELLAREHFDVVIVDVYLPVMDGPSVIAAVRSDERLRALPIIAVSAGGMAARTEALAAGADFFLHKPMRLKEVLASVRSLLHLE